MLPKHTPYDGSSPHFGIGLKPLDLQNWIEIDDQLTRFLEEKKRLMQEIPELVFAADHSSEQSQQEVLDLLLVHLFHTFPEIYRRNNNRIEIGNSEFRVDLNDISEPPLLKAAMLVQEDLVIMRKTEAGWRLVAASVCFPSSWVLREKIGKVMHDIHAPVPGFAKGTRNAGMIERIFDNLLVDMPVERFNWSIYNDDMLYHDDRIGSHFLNSDGDDAEYFLRVEHQTLRKLPVSGDILFTIRIHIDPMSVLKSRDDRIELADSFANTLREMSDEELRYKGLDEHCDQLIRRLMKVTQGK